tara:strand:- start:248 stop:469 length:222 start_codon:yes stop_codon:yes gene_type:complete
MENIVRGLKKKFYLDRDIENRGYALIKHNVHPRGWSIGIKDMFYKDGLREVYWSSTLKNLDAYISRHKQDLLK